MNVLMWCTLANTIIHYTSQMILHHPCTHIKHVINTAYNQLLLLSSHFIIFTFLMILCVYILFILDDILHTMLHCYKGNLSLMQNSNQLVTLKFMDLMEPFQSPGIHCQ